MHILDRARVEEDVEGVDDVTIGTEAAEEEEMDHAEYLWTSVDGLLLLTVAGK
jgi:hypothetical protein